MNLPKLSVLEKLAANSEYQGDCLVWLGAGNTPERAAEHRNYGVIGVGGGKNREVHRAAWIERHGMPPAETPFVLHRCDNPPCWADEHLLLGTQADNMADKSAKGRHHNQLKGSCDHGHPFTPDNIRWEDGKRKCKTCERARVHIRRFYRVKANV